MLRSRIELVTLELEEQRIHLTRIVLLGAVALFLFMLGMVMVSVLVVAWFWDTHRLLAIAGTAAVYLGGAAGLALAAKRAAATKPKMFGSTIAELTKDREQLRPGAKIENE
jgi:uncharacterized membrane protein YqjE